MDDDPGNLFLIVVFGFLLLLSGFFSAVEVAFVSLSPAKVRALAEERPGRVSSLIAALKNRPQHLLTTILIGNNLVNVFVASLATVVATDFFGSMGLGIATGATTFMILVFGEIIPKGFAQRHAVGFAFASAYPIYFLDRALSPITWFFGKLFDAFGPVRGKTMTEGELVALVDIGTEEGEIKEHEQKMIQNVLEFTDISAKEVMVPVTQMAALQVDTPLDAVLEVLVTEHFSRYPVYGKDLNDILGVLYQKDVLTALTKKQEVDIRSLLHRAYFVPETTKISAILKVMQRGRTHLAIVVNEYGAISGMVTIEDLIEELVGEIKDEFDEESPVKRIKGGGFLIDAAISLRDLREDHAIDMPEGDDYETLGGLVISELQEIPVGGETFRVGPYAMTVAEMDGKRVSKVRVYRKSEPVSDEATGK